MTEEKVFALKFITVYTALIGKAQRKSRTADEVDAITSWLTGYSADNIHEMMKDDKLTYGDFFRNAPAMNPERANIHGSICGVKLDEIETPLMRDIRVLDKLIDELAKGKSLSKVLRQEETKGRDR